MAFRFVFLMALLQVRLWSDTGMDFFPFSTMLFDKLVPSDESSAAGALLLVTMGGVRWTKEKPF